MWAHVCADLYVVLKGQCLSEASQCAGALYVGVLSFSQHTSTIINCRSGKGALQQTRTLPKVV